MIMLLLQVIAFHTVRDFVNKVAECLDMKIEWTGTGLNEKGIDENGNVIVEVNKRYFRNTEVDTLFGDANKAKKKSSWECKLILMNWFLK